MKSVPEDMRAELAAWNSGKGIELETWVGCMGSFKLAVGYSTIFWPRFVLFEGYILRDGFKIESLRGCEAQCKGDRRSVERVMNHLHIADIQHAECEDISADRLRFIGSVLLEIHQCKLQWQFPDRPCEVQFHEPENQDDLLGYELSFWQKIHL
jgi:hypothetical protein